MAFTFMSALTAAVVLSLTVMPVMASLFLARRVGGGDTFLMRFLKWLYAPVRLKASHGGGEPIDKPALIEAMQAALERNVPGNSYRVTQPIELRVQELVAGVRSAVGLSLYGDDLAVLIDLA